MVEAAAIPDDDLPVVDGRHGHGEGVAVGAGAQVLRHPDRRSGRGGEHPEGDGQLLAVEGQRHRLLLLAGLVQLRHNGRHVACHLQLLPDFLERLVDLLLPRMVPVVGDELVDLPPGFDGAATGLSLDPPVLHQPPKLRHLLPVAGVGVHLHEVQDDALSELGVAVDPAGPEQGPPEGGVRLEAR
ncbi:unnamed protein product [Spirodela intermedia]|uniref:Uncharacterized protein n=1 Tax=Spirodela intermedia TaxID=51605 RepID=A0A7I8KVU1_SPIIN|nr:unnamed protein product [Spirodela intermedia]